MTRRTLVREERPIGALIPRSIRRTPPPPAPLLALPPTEPDGLLLDLARLDRSGRLSARGLLRAPGRRAGHRVGIAVVDDAIVLTSVATGSAHRRC